MLSTISNGANDRVKKIGVIMQQYLKPYLRKSKHTKVKNSNPIGELPIGDLPGIFILLAPSISNVPTTMSPPHNTT
jgi:hypothetical protein